jgi:hypothetical protein
MFHSSIVKNSVILQERQIFDLQKFIDKKFLERKYYGTAENFDKFTLKFHTFYTKNIQDVFNSNDISKTTNCTRTLDASKINLFDNKEFKNYTLTLENISNSN